ncbi:MAG: anaerobic ribonucleoside-triphosphate reductase activating protein [Candidatus Omnitrophica bacterium]|nr:anaerobic ribonucleoside-triphosphate reductase activating protein [Candidatus Omnitrophota bacterium]
MKIVGFEKSSLIDYPGKISAVVFTQGCNFRCSYCHNPQLVYPHLFTQLLSIDGIFEFLEIRKKLLDAVTISGGEPTLQRGLIPFIEKIKNMGFLVKLDTNGSMPDILKEILTNGLIDFVAMDIKAPFEKYDRVCDVGVCIIKIKESIRMIEASGISFQFRTTYDTDLLEDRDLQEIRSFLNKPDSLLIQECLKRN